MPAGAAVLIATKLRAPGLRREYVPRRRLVARLRGGSARRLTLVTAPAGWGKTTLLAAWQAAEGEGSPFAWVSLDEHDNDPARFWSYVVQALREVRPERPSRPAAASPPEQRGRRGRGAAARQRAGRARAPRRARPRRLPGDRAARDPRGRRPADRARARVAAPRPRAFLAETSVLERLCGPLCDALTGRTDGQARLEALERSNMFLVPLDGRREWFRYHQLFRQLLHHELDPARRPILHVRATAWHLAHGTTLEAIHHALAGGDADTAVALVAEHWNATFNQGRLATVTGWLDALDPAAVRGHPSLCAARAWLALDAGRLDDAGPWIERAETAAPSTETAVLRAVHQFKLGDVGEAAAAAERARELAPAAASFAGTVAMCVLGFTAYWAGRREAALAALLDARRLANATGNDLAEAYATGYLALLAADDSALEEAAALVSHAVGLSDEPGFAEHFVLHVAHLADARTKLLGGELHAALEVAEPAVRLADRGAGRVEKVAVLAALARIRRALGDRAEARAAVARAHELLAECGDPGVVAAWVAELADRVRTSPRRASQAGDALTVREREILDLLAGPLSRTEIAAALFLSPDTVKTHLRGIYRKLSTSSRADTVSRARELGLL